MHNMINYLNNLINLAGLYFSFLRKLKYQRKFIKATLLIDIQESKSTNDGSLNDNDYKKITNYYGCAIPVLFGESYCLLKGSKMILKERMALTYLGGVTGLFDDFFDKKDLSESYIKELIENPNSNHGHNSYDKLILKFYGKALNYITHPELILNQFLNVHNAQVESKNQKSEGINHPEINNITLNKGGVSTLLFRSIFNEVLSGQEKQLMFKLGGLFQLENDIFDVYKDYIDGIKTLVTTEKNVINLRDIYLNLVEEVFNLVHQTNYLTTNKATFKRIIYLVFCRGLVCLDMLEKNQEATENVFDLGKYNRNELICDMEKPMNNFKLIHYFSKYNFDIKN